MLSIIVLLGATGSGGCVYIFFIARCDAVSQCGKLYDLLFIAFISRGARSK
jgi:hypothetical protein